MSHNITPVFTTDSDPWAPSMPNSDLWTLRSARDAAELMSPKMRGNGPIPRRVVALRTSPLGRYPPLTPSTSISPAAPAPLQQPLSTSQSDVLGSPQPLQQSGSRTIGLGHPSTSKRRVVPLKSDSAMSSPQPSPRPCPRINSSTIKRRTERFPRRELHAIAEHPVTTQQGSTSSRPVHGPRRRSYAQAVSAKQTPKKITGRRVTPTTTLTLPPPPALLAARRSNLVARL
ncbi:hypothetical protein B0H13DRAFT_230403 [Mycena leptocephala]|nr:hypothetical protein B0H13DRAFT_230403 [Mycena leptocephala]